MKRVLKIVSTILTIIFLFSFIVACNNDNSNEETPPPQNELTEVTVYTAKEFLNSIGSNKKIILASKRYNLSDAYNVQNDYVTKQGFSNGYNFKNVHNLIIEGEATILIDDLYADVLSFTECENITLSGITVGHSDYSNYYQCEGEVITIDSCDNVTINNCKLFGCGAVGLRSYSSQNVNIENSHIYDCSFAAINSDDSQISVNNSNIYDMTIDNRYGGMCVSNSSKFNFLNCDISNLNCPVFINIDDYDKDIQTEISFNQCNIKNNAFDTFISTSRGIFFNDCKIQNNTGVVEQNSSIYSKCTISNNIKGILIPNVKDYSYDYAVEKLDATGIERVVTYSYDDIKTDCKEPYGRVVSQNLVGVVSAVKTLELTVAQAAITINSVDWDINTASGVEPNINYTNNTDKQIAYIFFTVRFFDRMGYPAYCSIKDTDTQRLKVTGPINSGINKTSYWDPVIYNNSVGAIQPISAEIRFTDGTSQNITYTGRYWFSNSYYGGELHD